jgi:hypothetical protein
MLRKPSARRRAVSKSIGRPEVLDFYAKAQRCEEELFNFRAFAFNFQISQCVGDDILGSGLINQPHIIPVIPRFMREIHGYPACDGRMDTPDKPGYDGV